MKKRVLISFILIISTALTSFAAVQPELFLSLYNQKIYHPGNPVHIKVEIRNSGITPISFKLADQRVHNIKLEVKTVSNDPLEECDNCIKEFISSQPVYYTEIRLKPGEEFSFILVLSDFVDINKAGKYFIKASFYPEFRSNKIEPSISNSIELEVAPLENRNSEEKESPQPKALKLVPEPLHPDKVIEYTLNARIAAETTKNALIAKEEWNKYFLYFNIEELYLKSGEDKKEYLKLSDNARINKLAEYREWLINGEKDRDLLLVPTGYDITKTSYTQNSAIVVVKEEFDNGRFVDKKQYTYYLRKIDTIWTIYDYSITNIMEANRK